MGNILDAALNNGIWCALFVILLYWTITENKKRETIYQTTIKENQSIIKSLTETVKGDVCLIKTDILDIKEELKGKVEK